MFSANRAASQGVKDGKLIIRLVDDSEKKFVDATLAPQACTDVLVALLEAANGIPAPLQTMAWQGKLPHLTLRTGYLDPVQPCLVLGIGHIEIPMALSGDQLAVLHADIGKMLEVPAQKH